MKPPAMYSDSKAAAWIEAMKARGHSPILGDDGTLDYFAYDGDTHNGPGCSVCGWSCCWHCDDVEDIPVCDVLEGEIIHNAIASR